MNVYLYPAPKEWYENMPEPPRTDPVKGVITVNNKEDCQSALNYYNKYISPIERTRNYASPPRNLQHSWFMRTYGASGDDVKLKAKEICQMIKFKKNPLEYDYTPTVSIQLRGFLLCD